VHVVAQRLGHTKIITTFERICACAAINGAGCGAADRGNPSRLKAANKKLTNQSAQGDIGQYRGRMETAKHPIFTR
jgi:hypothetical protein